MRTRRSSETVSKAIRDFARLVILATSMLKDFPGRLPRSRPSRLGLPFVFLKPAQCPCPGTCQFSGLSRQPFQELVVNPAETAIAEHHHDFAALSVLGHVGDDRLDVRQVSR